MTRCSFIELTLTNQRKDRKPNRLKGFDYSCSGAYFITVCVKDMRCVLSTNVGADDLGSPQVCLKEYGSIVDGNIRKMNEIYADVNKDYAARYDYLDENPKKWIMGKDEYYT